MDNVFGDFLSGINAAQDQQANRQRYRFNEARMQADQEEAMRRREAAIRAQQEAHEAARRTSRESQIMARGFGLAGRSMGAAQGLGAPAPMGAPIQQPIAPMQAPEPQQGAYEDGGTVTVRGIRAQRPEPLENPSQADLIDQMMVAAYQDNDMQRFTELAGQRQTMMSEEEQRGRQLIGSAAVQILNMPPEQRQAAVRMALEQFGVDPASTGIDDITDPAQLESALRFEAFRGAPADWVKEQIRVQGTRDEFRRPDIIDQGNQRTVVSMSGPTAGQAIQSFEVRPDPNAQLSAQTQRRGQDIQAQIAAQNRASQQRIAGINANTRLTIQQRQEALARENMANQRAIAAIRGGVGGMDLGDIENDPMWEPVQ
jgi:hypothetical protein